MFRQVRHVYHSPIGFVTVSLSMFLLKNHYFLCNIRCSNLRGELHINFPTQCVNMTLAGGEGALSLVRSWSSQKLSNFKVHECSWTASELCTCLIIEDCKINPLLKPWARILRVLSSCPATPHIHRWTLWKKLFFCRI